MKTVGVAARSVCPSTFHHSRTQCDEPLIIFTVKKKMFNVSLFTGSWHPKPGSMCQVLVTPERTLALCLAIASLSDLETRGA